MKKQAFIILVLAFISCSRDQTNPAEEFKDYIFVRSNPGFYLHTDTYKSDGVEANFHTLVILTEGEVGFKEGLCRYFEQGGEGYTAYNKGRLSLGQFEINMVKHGLELVEDTPSKLLIHSGEYVFRIDKIKEGMMVSLTPGTEEEQGLFQKINPNDTPECLLLD